jgi:plastocyanin
MATSPLELRTRAVSRSVASIVGALFSLTACGLGGAAYQSSPNGDAAVVEMTNTWSFVPDDLTVRVGQTVEWRNRSIFTHTVTDDRETAEDPADAVLPAGAETFSFEIAPGEIHRRVFHVPGTYRYFCEPHEGFDMVGRLVVEPAT